MNGLGCEMQSKSDTAYCQLPDQTSPSRLEGQALAVQGSPVSCSWHGVGGGVEWGGGKGEMGEWWGSAQLQLYAKPSFPSLSN